MGRKMKGFESGVVDITTDGGGDGAASITFDNPMDSADYAVIATSQEADDTGLFDATSKTVNGFTLGVDASSVTAGTLTAGWVAKQNAF